MSTTQQEVSFMSIPKKLFHHLTEKDTTIIAMLLHAKYSISEIVIQLQKHL